MANGPLLFLVRLWIDLKEIWKINANIFAHDIYSIFNTKNVELQIFSFCEFMIW